MSIETRIREYRQGASQAQAKKARAQAELDAAAERVTASRAALKEQFGVETSEEARALQAQLQAELAEKEAAIEAAFAEAGA